MPRNLEPADDVDERRPAAKSHAMTDLLVIIIISIIIISIIGMVTEWVLPHTVVGRDDGVTQGRLVIRVETVLNPTLLFLLYTLNSLDNMYMLWGVWWREWGVVRGVWVSGGGGGGGGRQRESFDGLVGRSSPAAMKN